MLVLYELNFDVWVELGVLGWGADEYLEQEVEIK